MVRQDPKTSQGFVEGIGFIKGPYNIISKEELTIPYIVIGSEENVSPIIEKLALKASKIKFVGVKVKPETLEVVRKVVSTHYPRFLCMNDIDICFAGHSGLSRFAWNTKLNTKSGYPIDNTNLYGFTLLSDMESGFILKKTTGSLTMFDSKNEACLQAQGKLDKIGLKVTKTIP